MYRYVKIKFRSFSRLTVYADGALMSFDNFLTYIKADSQSLKTF